MINPLEVLLLVIVTPMLAFIVGALLFSFVECHQTKNQQQKP